MDIFDCDLKRSYDFFCLSVEENNQFNLGYVFVNFKTPLYILDFMSRYNNKRWHTYNSFKVSGYVYMIINSLCSAVPQFETLESSSLNSYHVNKLEVCCLNRSEP